MKIPIFMEGEMWSQEAHGWESMLKLVSWSSWLTSRSLLLQDWESLEAKLWVISSILHWSHLKNNQRLTRLSFPSWNSFRRNRMNFLLSTWQSAIWELGAFITCVASGRIETPWRSNQTRHMGSAIRIYRTRGRRRRSGYWIFNQYYPKRLRLLNNSSWAN